MSRGNQDTPYRLGQSDGLPVLGESRMVLWLGEAIPRRFDYSYNRWVEDRAKLSLYVGNPDVIPISEAEARYTIELFGGTWSAPS